MRILRTTLQYGLFVLIMLFAAAAFSAIKIPHYDDVIENYRKLMREGKAEEIVKEADRIIAESEKFIRNHPRSKKCANAMLNMALVYGVYGKRDFKKAEAIYEEIIRKYPKHKLMPIVKYRYGKNIMQGFGFERFDEAMKVFEEVAVEYPKSDFAARASIEKANRLFHLGEVDIEKLKEAFKIYEQIVVEHPDSVSAAESAIKLAGYHLNQLDLEKARVWIDKLANLSNPLAEDFYGDIISRYTAYDIYLNKNTISEAKMALSEVLGEIEELERKVRVLNWIIEINTHFKGRERWDLVDHCVHEANGFFKEVKKEKPVWVAKAKMEIASSYYHVSWGTRGEEMSHLLKRAVDLFHEIVEQYPDTPEAEAAMAKLAEHYVVVEKNYSKSKDLNLKYLKLNPPANAGRYIKTVSKIMRNREFQLNLSKSETLERARRVMKKYPELSSTKRHRFLRRVDNWYHNEEVEKTLSKVMKYAEEKGNRELLKETLILQGECYFRKERPMQAVEYLKGLKSGYAGIFSSDEIEHINDYLAMSYYWLRNYEKSAALFKGLQTIAPEPSDKRSTETRTVPYYMHWQAITLIDKGEYETGKEILKEIIVTYPDTKWGKRSAEYLEYLSPVLEGLSLAEKGDK